MPLCVHTCPRSDESASDQTHECYHTAAGECCLPAVRALVAAHADLLRAAEAVLTARDRSVNAPLYTIESFFMALRAAVARAKGEP